MRLLKLIPLFSLFLMLGGQVMFLPGQAYAWQCCTSCPCKPTCLCPGVGGCPYFRCHTDDSPIFQGQTLVLNEMLDIRGNYDSRPSPDRRPNSTGRLITLTSSGQCAGNNFTLKFFNTAVDRLKFDPDFLKYNANQDNNM
jgi:hypothetical protein